jgi:putative YhbY family RNA-binding protein
MRTLASAERRALRAKAHSLHPVVAIGQHGLTPAVLHEIDVNLLAHELIKIRVFGDERAERDALLARICDDLDAAPVQHLGKILTIWRPAPPPEAVPVEDRPRRRDRTGAAAHPGKGAAKTTESRRPGVGSGVRHAPRRGRCVIVDAVPATNPRRRLAPAGGKKTAQSGPSQAPHGKSASSRVGASGARRRRKAR